MGSDDASFGELLRRLRTAAALSQAELAERAGLSLRGISDLERGVRRTPHFSTVRQLADALALGLADRDLLYGAARPGRRSGTRTGATERAATLPTPLTSLIDRERELADLCNLVRGGARLVTVTGAGGTGKTRLALEAAARLRPAFADGAAFVDLAPLRDARLVLPAIASALGVRERLGQSLPKALARSLAPQHLLLVADNFEHVLAAAPEVTALLTAAPRLAVLATSREPLRLRGERLFVLPPLPLPPAERSSAISSLARVPAVALFVERALARDADFALTRDNVADVVTICRRLDGLPLAIELAAARTGALSPPALLARLGRRLPLLSAADRDAPPRQRTMRDAIGWSYDLLSPEEQGLFRCLSVFAGGWTLESAEAMHCGHTELEVLTGLEELVNANLVHVLEQPRGGRRFGMLETVREFGMEHVANHGEAEELGRRHAEFFLALARAPGAPGAAAAPEAWLASLAAEEANLRVALTWLRDHGQAAAGLRLAVALAPYWHVRSANAEGRAWLETFLARTRTDESSVTERIAALRWAGELAGLQGEAASAEAHLRTCLALARDVADQRGIADALRAVGSAAMGRGDVPAGIAALTEAAALSRELGDPRRTAFLLAYLGYAEALEGDLTRGEALTSEAEALLCSPEDRRSFEADLAVLIQGWIAILRGDFARAEDRLQAAVALGRGLSAKANLSPAYAGLAEVALARGQPEAALRRYREGLLSGWAGEFPAGMLFNLLGLVHIGSQRGAFAAVAPLIAAVDTFGPLVRIIPPAIITRYEAEVGTVRSALGEERFAMAWSAARARSLEETVDDALELVDNLLSA